MLQKDYNKGAALAFIMDRYAYLHGTSKDLLALVDYIQEKSPATPIAPQMVVRKARLIKNDGDLQGIVLSTTEFLSVTALLTPLV